MTMRDQARAIGVAVTALWGLWPASARAASAEPTYALSWSRSDGARDCITSSALARAVEARLGRSVFVSPAAAEFTLEARIEGGPGQWSASITLQDREGHRIGQRELRSVERDCRALDPSLSLMLALTIDPNATMTVGGAAGESLPRMVLPEPPPARPPPSVVRASVDAPPPPILPATPQPESRFSGPYGEGALRLGFGLLPGGAAPGLEVAAAVPVHESWVARVGASVWLPAQAQGADGGVTISQFTANAALCGRWRGASAFLLLCGGVEPGVLAASGYGFTESFESERRFGLTVGPGAKLGLRLGGRWWAQVGGDLLFPIIRHEFFYLNAAKNSVDVHKLPAVAGAAGLAILLAFP